MEAACDAERRIARAHKLVRRGIISEALVDIRFPISSSPALKKHMPARARAHA
jgi:hypothetical protein